MKPVFDHFADDWMRYAPNCWIVWTDRPPTDFYYAIHPRLKPKDSMLIVGLNMDERSGWLPRWIWDWIDKKRELGPPKPTALPPKDLPLGLLGAPFGVPPAGGLLGLGENALLKPGKPKK